MPRPSRLFVCATTSWVPHPLRRSWLLVFQLRSKGWVRSPFDSQRTIASQSFRHDAEILATHPSLRSKKQKRSCVKDVAPTVWKVLSARTRKGGPHFRKGGSHDHFQPSPANTRNPEFDDTLGATRQFSFKYRGHSVITSPALTPERLCP